ncbi:hypothetical protein BB560_003687 [Smittium megazygosporum]|uniref:Dihydrolipoamide acetyltransferase component of pyruvate dehydrogenase complex n=1 Tax=Smittium megazygosporum TaxID=133381 RepID=A0A2T9ZBC3_9FUNG|nr:hypothetical protein BB560_003687 [Smittium megazygosporum]
MGNPKRRVLFDITAKEYVKPGDKVSQFDKVCEVQSDKAAVDITSRYDGVVKELLYKENEIALIGKPLMLIDTLEDSEGSSDAPAESAEEPDINVKIKPKQESDTKNVLASSSTTSEDLNTKPNASVRSTPAVRFFAKKQKIDLTKLKPTGKRGLITKDDVIAYMEARDRAESPKVDQAKAGTDIQDLQSTSELKQQAETFVKLSQIQKTMIRTMTASLSIPHFGFSDEVNVDKLVSLRKSVNQSLSEFHFGSENGLKKITYMPFFIKAISLSLLKYPIINAKLVAGSEGDSDTQEPHIVYRSSHNIGIAVDTPSGLLVPNIKDVQSKSILEIASELDGIVNLGRAGKLSTSHLSGTTFTISNVGNLGGIYASPVIVPGQVCIVALGKIRRVPTFVSEVNPVSGATTEKVVPAHILVSNYSADHRIIDGATMVRFSNHFKYYLEHIDEILLSLK